jgi:hypothetical protein
VAHFSIDASSPPPGSGPSELVPAGDTGWRRASQRALWLFSLGTGGLIFAFLAAALTGTVSSLAAVTFALPTALLSLGFAWAIWALAEMDQAREMRSGAIAATIVAFPLLTGALLSLVGALCTLIAVYLARA